MSTLYTYDAYTVFVCGCGCMWMWMYVDVDVDVDVCGCGCMRRPASRDGDSSGKDDEALGRWTLAV